MCRSRVQARRAVPASSGDPWTRLRQVEVEVQVQDQDQDGGLPDATVPEPSKLVTV